MKSISRILVTGSSGTIGTALCETLLGSGFDVTGADIKPNKWNPEVQKRTINIDLRQDNLAARLPGDMDMVIHLAANARVYNLVVQPSLALDNILMVYNVLEYARNSGVKRILFASSREVYGNSSKEVHDEDDARIDSCESAYTASKISGEALIHAYRRCYGIDSVILRFSNVYGKYDESDRLIPLYIKLTSENIDLVVYGRDKLLDFTHIDDTVKGIMLTIDRFEDVKSSTFNIASGKGVSIIQVAELVKNIIPSSNKVIIDSNRTGEVVKYIADITRAEKELGYHPAVDIKEGIRRSAEWYSKIYPRHI